MSTPIRYLGLALGIAVIVTLCLVSFAGAAIVGACTLLAVLLDARRPQSETRRADDRLLVDLTRRSR